jgi:hypothetical protein
MTQGAAEKPLVRLSWGVLMTMTAILTVGCAGHAVVGRLNGAVMPVCTGEDGLQQDRLFLSQLNEQVQHGSLSENDRDKLWGAYLVRLFRDRWEERRRLREAAVFFVPPAF